MFITRTAGCFQSNLVFGSMFAEIRIRKCTPEIAGIWLLAFEETCTVRRTIFHTSLQRMCCSVLVAYHARKSHHVYTNRKIDTSKVVHQYLHATITRVGMFSCVIGVM